MKTNMYKKQFNTSVEFSKDFKERTIDNLNALIDEKEALASKPKKGSIIPFVRRFSAVAAVLAITTVAVFLVLPHLSQPDTKSHAPSVSISSQNSDAPHSDTDTAVLNNGDSTSSSVINSSEDNIISSQIDEDIPLSSTPNTSAPLENTEDTSPTESDNDAPLSDENLPEGTDDEATENHTDEDIQNSTSRKHNYSYTVNDDSITVSDTQPDLSSTLINKGTNITFEVYLENDAALCGVSGSVLFDNSCLALLKNSAEDYAVSFDNLGINSIDSTTGYGKSDTSSNAQVHCALDSEGKLTWECAALGRGFDFSSSASLIRVTFVTTDDIYYSSYELMKLIGFSYDEVFDTDYNEVPKQELSGSITLEIG